MRGPRRLLRGGWRVFPAAAMTMALVVAVAPSANAYAITLVDKRGDDQQASSLALSRGGTVFVAWEGTNGAELWWGQWTGSQWNKTLVHRVGPGASCFQEAPNPVARIQKDGSHAIVSACSWMQIAPEISLSSDRSGKWRTRVIDTVSPPFNVKIQILNLAFCVNPKTGAQNIFYGDTNDVSVHWVHFANKKWIDDYIYGPYPGAGVDGPTVACAFDRTGHLGIVTGASYVHPYIPTYWSYDAASGKWKSFDLPALNGFGFPSITFGSDGAPWVAFQQLDGSNSHLEVGTLINQAWTMTTVDATASVTGAYPSATTSAGLPRIAYYNVSSGDLRLAFDLGARWKLVTVQSQGRVGVLPSLSFNRQGKAEISYWSSSSKAIFWARA